MSRSGPGSEDQELGAVSRSGSGTGQGQGLVQKIRNWVQFQGQVQVLVEVRAWFRRLGTGCSVKVRIRYRVEGRGQGLVQGSRSGPGSEYQELGAVSRSGSGTGKGSRSGSCAGVKFKAESRL
jgi:hypothetical protein